MPLLVQQDSPSEPEYVLQIRRHKEEIAAQIGPLLDAGHALEDLGAYVTDGTDRLGAIFSKEQPDSAEPLVAVVPISDMALLAESVEPGMGVHFRDPAPRWHIRILSCVAGVAYPVLLRCFPDHLDTA